MSVSFFPRSLGVLLITLLAAGTGGAADSRNAKGTIPTGKSSASASKSGASRTGKAQLPDPTLLDGSTHPAEKRPEYGMVGDFELPGDENARTDRVGGPQSPGGGKGGGKQNAAGIPGLPTPGQPSIGSSESAIPQVPDSLAQQGQGQGGGPENPAAAGKQVEGGGQQGAQPQGAQVGQLSGQAGGPEQGEIGQQSPQVSIGDSAMQIQTIASPGVVGGTQPAGKTQQHEKTPGSGGKQAQGNNSNRGAERGRAMPAGL